MFKLRFRFHNSRALPRKCYFLINRPSLPPPDLIKSLILSKILGINKDQKVNKLSKLFIRENFLEIVIEEEEILNLKLENERLKEGFAANIAVLEKISQISSLSKDCPSDLYARLEAAVDSSSFLTKIESLIAAICTP
ncbi:uncharacterized protein A4U43_C09F10070 [Asparagus officinalis]|uniref:Uncharacterized protein n=1 Tax=Asparagus officinalis TaxID=4686 RepID=A0A5P1E8B3_ASPOF|nr:uncharacterized protein A4U43_C09F10070 [Asparagus officinalis]